MSESMNPRVVTQFEHGTWSRCAESYLDTFAGITAAGAIVTGVDFSAQMVTVARRQYPGITFQEGNAEELPFAAGPFDAVVSNVVVHHLARPTVVFREVCRVLI